MPPADRSTWPDEPATYRIAVRGALDSSWSGHLSDMAIAPDAGAFGEPVTVLTGQLADQAALLGVLNHLAELGLALVSVERDA
jgi:RNA binding exosome subunit